MSYDKEEAKRYDSGSLQLATDTVIDMLGEMKKFCTAPPVDDIDDPRNRWLQLCEDWLHMRSLYTRVID